MRFNLYKVVSHPFNNMDIGLDLLMNPSKKTIDQMSHHASSRASSRASSVKDFSARSEKSIKIDR